MKTNFMETKEELKKAASNFIKAANVMPLVYAKEGGVIYLENLLIDFVEYLELTKID